MSDEHRLNKDEKMGKKVYILIIAIERPLWRKFVYELSLLQLCEHFQKDAVR